MKTKILKEINNNNKFYNNSNNNKLNLQNRMNLFLFLTTINLIVNIF